MVKITACVITKNEEHNIVRWLTCMKRITKDLVVVDTGSTDNTVQIAKQYGAKVFSFTWVNDFSAAKNFAIAQAKGEWIIFLDADEYFTEHSLKNLRKYIEIYHPKPNVDALICKIINIDDNDHDRFISEFYNLRMFRNKPGIRYRRPIHEMLGKSIGSLQTYILPDGVEVYHTGYSTQIIQDKLKRNLQIILDEIDEIGEQAYHYRYLCECYHGMENYEMAEKYAKLFIEKGERTFGTDNSIHKQLIGCMINLHRDEDLVIATIDKFITEFPGDPEFLWYKGELLFLREDYAQAECLLRQFIAQCEATKDRIEYGETSLEKKWCRAYYPLGVIALLKGERKQAIAFFQESLRRYRYNSLILHELLKALADYPEREIVKVLGLIYENKEMDMRFILDNAKGVEFPALDYYNHMLMRERVVSQDIPQDSILRELGDRLAELYELSVLSVTLSTLPQRDDVLAVLLPPTYQHVYRKLNGEDVQLSAQEEAIYHRLSEQCNEIKENSAVKQISPEMQVTLAKCLNNIALDIAFAENCNKLIKICLANEIQYGDLIYLLNTEVEQATNVTLRIAMHLYQHGKELETIRFMIAALKQNPNDEDLLYALALFFKLAGDKQNALKLLENYRGTRLDVLALKSELIGK